MSYDYVTEFVFLLFFKCKLIGIAKDMDTIKDIQLSLITKFGDIDNYKITSDYLIVKAEIE